MHARKTLLAAAAAALLGAAPAIAADAIEETPQAPAAPVDYTQPSATWAGPYAGVFAAYGWAEHDTGGVKTDQNGFSGGVFAGYNMQSGNFVYGVEGDLGRSGANNDNAGIQAEQGIFGSLRARAGVAFDPFMLYGTAGVAAANTTLNDGTNKDDQNLVGYTLGVGADAALTENVFGRVEYRFSDYGKKDFNLGGATVSSGFDEHSVRAGIGMKF